MTTPWPLKSCRCVRAPAAGRRCRRHPCASLHGQPGRMQRRRIRNRCSIPVFIHELCRPRACHASAATWCLRAAHCRRTAKGAPAVLTLPCQPAPCRRPAVCYCGRGPLCAVALVEPWWQRRPLACRTLLTITECVLDPRRNPGLTQQQAEACFASMLGVQASKRWCVGGTAGAWRRMWGRPAAPLPAHLWQHACLPVSAEGHLAAAGAVWRWRGAAHRQPGHLRPAGRGAAFVAGRRRARRRRRRRPAGGCQHEAVCV